MIELKNEKIAIPVVLFAGILWSFGPLVVRYMDNPNLVPWQYIFGRGLTIFIILNLYLYFEEGKNFYKNYKKSWSIRNNWWLWTRNCDDFFYLFYYKYHRSSNSIMLGCDAFFYSYFSLFIFKGKNFNKCLDINFSSINWYYYHGFWKH